MTSDADSAPPPGLLPAVAKAALFDLLTDEDSFAEMLKVATNSTCRDLSVFVQCVAEIRDELIDIFNSGDE